MRSKRSMWIIVLAVLVIVLICSFAYVLNNLKSKAEEEQGVKFENPQLIEQMQDACYAGNEEQFEFLVAQIKALYPESPDSDMADIYVGIFDELNKAKED